MDVMALIIAVVLMIVMMRGSQPRSPRRPFLRRTYLWLYLRCIVNAWLILGVVGIIVLHDGIPFTSLGLQIPDSWWLTLLALIGVGILSSVGMVLHLRFIKDELVAPEWAKKLALPRITSERVVWAIFSIHVGIWEEIAFRGFLPWYLSHHLALFGFALPYAGAAIVSLILFSLGHLYQGRMGALLTGFLGIILMLLYALTGNLFASCLLHILFDARFSFGTPPISEGLAPLVEERKNDEPKGAPLPRTPRSFSPRKQKRQQKRHQNDQPAPRIPYTHMVVAQIGDSSKLNVGQDVMAIGNPLGITQTATTGIISALNRSVTESANTTISNAIQTDASINPGNSGGALINLQGQLIGIPTLGAVDGEFNTPANGVGFAIPSNRIVTVVHQILQQR